MTPHARTPNKTYTAALGASERLVAQEWIAGLLYDYPVEGNLLDAEDCRALADAILLGVLAFFRPDLVSEKVPRHPGDTEPTPDDKQD